jgi:AraC-like DNA-binding protein
LLAEADEIQTITPTDRPISTFTIFWPRSELEQIGCELGLDEATTWPVTRLSAGPLSERFAALQALLASGADADAILQAYGALAADVVQSEHQSREFVASRSPSHPGVRRALRRLRESFAESLSLEDLANELSMSKCHLARCFERSLGIPPHRYRRLLRLRAARRLLERGLSVGEAANETGFADAPHLTRAFREWLGVSPGAWGSAWRAGDPWRKDAPQTIAPPRSC